MCLPTTSKLSTGDSSFESSDGPSRKRCRPPAATVTSSIHALVPSCADLLPPCKRFRDSISLEDSVEEDIDTDVLEDIEADAMAVEVAVDRDVEAGVDTKDEVESSDRGTMEVGVDVVTRVDIPDDMIMPDAEVDVEDEIESSDRGTMEVGVDVVTRVDIPDDMIMPDAVEHLKQVEKGHKELEARSLIAGGERVSLLDQNMTINRSGMTLEAIEELVNRRVEEMLAAYEATRATNALEAKS
nr:hypothetical protein [Tanacetum cinerariifolium]